MTIVFIVCEREARQKVRKDEEREEGAREQRGRAKEGKGPRVARLETEQNFGTCVFNLTLKSSSDTSALGESSLASGNQIADIGLLTSDSFLVGHESGFFVEV